MIATLEKCNTEIDQRDFPALFFKPVAIDHAYIPKKNAKEFQSVDGLLKYSSLCKHFELLPSVVIITAGFSVDWQAFEWNRLNESLLGKVNSVRGQLKGREVKVVVVAIKIGSGQIAQEILEERIGNLRRHLSLEIQRTFIALSMSDLMLQPLTASMKKLSKNLRELSYLYYNNLEKRARFLMKTARIRGPHEGILTARYSFKVAYFLSFQGSKLQSLKYYRQCFESLIGVVLNVDEELLDQLKGVAEFAHFKICTMLLQIGSVKEAIAQFIVHITTFTKVYSEMLWRHYSWVSDQYLIFLQLLDLYRVSNTILLTESVDRFFFLQNALRFSMQRQENFRLMSLKSHENKNENLYNNNTIECRKENGNENIFRNKILNFVILPAKYVGAIPILIDPDLGSDSGMHSKGQNASSLLSLSEMDLDKNKNNIDPEILLKYLSECEKKFDLKGLIFRLLNRCDDYLTSSTEINIRRRNNLSIIMSQQMIKNEQYHDALNKLINIVEILRNENWMMTLVPIIRDILKCSLLLGRPKEYLSAVILLFTLGNKNNNNSNNYNENFGENFHLDQKEKETLNYEILSILKCDQIDICHHPIISEIEIVSKKIEPKNTKQVTEDFFSKNPPGDEFSISTTFPKKDFSSHADNHNPNSDSELLSPLSPFRFYRNKNYGLAASVDRPPQQSLPLRSSISKKFISFSLLNKKELFKMSLFQMPIIMMSSL